MIYNHCVDRVFFRIYSFLYRIHIIELSEELKIVSKKEKKKNLKNS